MSWIDRLAVGARIESLVYETIPSSHSGRACQSSEDPRPSQGSWLA